MLTTGIIQSSLDDYRILCLVRQMLMYWLKYKPTRTITSFEGQATEQH